VAFFDTVVNMYQNLTTYDWLAGAGIYPDSSKTWTYTQLTSALAAHYGFTASLDCSSGEVFQVSYYYRLIGQ
jgi:ribonuclease T2